MIRENARESVESRIVTRRWWMRHSPHSPNMPTFDAYALLEVCRCAGVNRHAKQLPKLATDRYPAEGDCGGLDLD